MNWLAHVYLSEPDIDFRLGNLLADLVTAEELAIMPGAFQSGVQRHRAIDAYTDSHPVVLRSRARLKGEHRRYAGILVDVIYDHFLALDWERYSPELLESFVDQFHAQIATHQRGLPVAANEVLGRIVSENRLASYRHIEGVGCVLQRLSENISQRTGRVISLERALPQLQACHGELQGDFTEFFPQLRGHVESLA